MPRKKKRLCFVLMPFKDEMKDVYWSAIKPACEEAGYRNLRVDELKGPFNIHRKIIEYIFISDAIISDLTEWNPTNDQFKQIEKLLKEHEDWKREWFEPERPAHKVYLDAFFIDQYLVTNARYADFLNDWGKDVDEDGQKMIKEYERGVHKIKDCWEPQQEFENHPVVYVTW